jgi:hypothetical protein
MSLLRAARDLRIQVADSRSFHGDPVGMSARLEKVREYVAAVEIHATTVGLLVPDTLAEPADRLAAAARNLTEAAARDTCADQGWLTADPDFAEIDACVQAFMKMIFY